MKQTLLTMKQFTFLAMMAMIFSACAGKIQVPENSYGIHEIIIGVKKPQEQVEQGVQVLVPEENLTVENVKEKFSATPSLPVPTEACKVNISDSDLDKLKGTLQTYANIFPVHIPAPDLALESMKKLPPKAREKKLVEYIVNLIEMLKISNANLTNVVAFRKELTTILAK